MANFIAQGISRKGIRSFVKYVRELCGFQDSVYFPVVEFFELKLPELVDDFTYEIVEYESMKDKEGETIPSRNLIKIREDVYDKAIAGDGRARFTILHEVGHLLMHDNDRVALCRASGSATMKTYEDPEWQADVFAGEMLMAEHLIKNMSVDEIAVKCGASHAAASCQYKQIRR